MRRCSFSGVKDFPHFAESFNYDREKSSIAHVLSNSLQLICTAVPSLSLTLPLSTEVWETDMVKREAKKGLNTSALAETEAEMAMSLHRDCTKNSFNTKSVETNVILDKCGNARIS